MQTTVKRITDFAVSKTLGIFLNVLYFFSAQRSTALAYTLFSTPQSGRLSPERLPQFLQAARSERLQLGPHQIQTYQWTGSGPTILLIHGWQSNSSRWQQLIEYLQGCNYHLITLDAPGQGLSNGKEFSPPIYASFIDLALRKFRPKILISHSLGSFSSLYQLAQSSYPHLEKNIILGCPNAFKNIVRNFQKLLSFSDRNYHHLVGRLENMINMSLEDYNSDRFIQQIALPTLVIHDIADETIPLAEAVSIANASPNTTLLVTENLGHSLQDLKVYRSIALFISPLSQFPHKV
ncbi:alpha/beta fold hydrolase [Flavobacterium sp. JP2137]|uniref:alpha/beta fold hydrolase n=1 Tax=Flavobacterium sp. JP2137 TaxID=3414510 RepID=UPI003D2FDE34